MQCSDFHLDSHSRLDCAIDFGQCEAVSGESRMKQLHQSIEKTNYSTPTMGDRFGILHRTIEQSGAQCEIELPDGSCLQCGTMSPQFRIIINNDQAFSAGFDELSVAEAYVTGQFDIEGDMSAAMDLRAVFPEKLRLAMLFHFWIRDLLNPLRFTNKEVIDFHYSLGDDFYLTFIDTQYRFYSHGIFKSEADSLEQASTQKLEIMYEALKLQPGMRLLDIGGGWGGVAEYCGSRGVHVTELTIAEDSYSFIEQLIAHMNLPATVYRQDFLEHQPKSPYDSVVIYGVIEHIPNYRRFCTHVWDCLKPGGLLYLDASASKKKYDVSMFARRYIWPGTHTFLCIPDLTQELLLHGFDVVEVQNETRDYELTMRHWAERLDEAKDQIISKWGEQTYRTFRLYLWGGSRAFHNDLMQAYHVVARKRSTRGRRPRLLARTADFVRGLF